ncbi:MAG: hypothetical protein LUF04_05115 [Bacteroides sp.]|nr:hypothetical protein [Bacteroides sp.]
MEHRKFRLIDLRESIDTKGLPKEIGSICDFPVFVQTIEKEGRKQNVFFLEGKTRYAPASPYFLDASHPSRSFANLLERIPAMIQTHENEIRKLEREIPVWQEIVSTPFRKEKIITELKTQLKAIDKRLKDFEQKIVQKKNQHKAKEITSATKSLAKKSRRQSVKASL